MRVTLNGESTPKVWSSIDEADWPEAVRQRYLRFVAELRVQYKIDLQQPVVAANYATPSPYRNTYDRGRKNHTLVVTIGRSVYATVWEAA